MKRLVTVLVISALSLGASALANPNWDCLLTENMGSDVQYIRAEFEQNPNQFAASFGFESFGAVVRQFCIQN